MALFGTDGVRGVANDTLTAELAYRVAGAVGARLGPGARVLIGRDTRVSGPMLEAASVAGLTEAGVETVSLGVAPTPAVAALVPRCHAQAGLVISASHNPPEYNGLKWLADDGRKWPEAVEADVARAVDRGVRGRVPSMDLGAWRAWPEALEQYRSRLVGLFAGRVPKVRAVVDLAHGAAGVTAPEVLERLGIACDVWYGEPRGALINRQCGATHPEVLAHAVRVTGADIGFAFDGDADRVMVADGSGRILNGDAVLYLLALGMRAEGRLREDRVVATVMSNLALEHALAAHGIAMERTPVGDRWVADRMAETGAVLGGEQSGHIILADWAVTGDGLLTALAVLAEMQRSGRPASELAVDLTPYPQLLKNVKLGQIPPDWDERPEIKEAVRACAADLGADGRVFIRPSGTEPLLRIMLEGRDVDRIQSWADRLAAVVQEVLESATEPLGQ